MVSIGILPIVLMQWIIKQHTPLIATMRKYFDNNTHLSVMIMLVSFELINVSGMLCFRFWEMLKLMCLALKTGKQ